MVTKSQKIRLGIFVSMSLVALLITIGIIVAPNFLQRQDIYYIGYQDISVTGLQKGGSVKYHGITVGFVNDIFIDPKDVTRVIVEVSVKPETPIKKDVYADIDIIGITGIKVIELRGGSNEADLLKPGQFINPGKSMTEMITGKAEVIAEKAEITLNNLAELTSSENQRKLIDLMINTSNTMTEVTNFFRKNDRVFTSTISNTEEITAKVKELVPIANSFMKNLDNLSRSDSLRQIVGNLVAITDALKRAELIGLIQDLNVAIGRTNRILTDMDRTLAKSRSDFDYALESMKESIENLNQFTRMIQEDPSLLLRGAKPSNAPDFNWER